MSKEQVPELTDLLSIIFVVYADNGPKVVFRYPHDVDNRNEDPAKEAGVFPKPQHVSPVPEGQVQTSKQLLNSFRDSSLESVLIPMKTEGCNKRFYVQIDSVIFVGYPFNADKSTKNMYNIVFAVDKGTQPHVIDSLVNLSTRMSVALSYEERNCSYLTESLNVMDRHYSEADIPSKEHIDPHTMDDKAIYITEHCPFKAMIEDPLCNLPTNLNEVFDSIRNNLSAKVLINKTVNFSFFIQLDVSQDIRTIIAPFESFVMLEDPSKIKNSLNCDSSPSLIKLLELERPYFRSLRDIAFSIDLEYEEIREAVLALVRWRKVLIIYPIVSTNEYMLSHTVPITQYPQYSEQFAEEFPGYDFYTELSKFSQRTNLSEILDIFEDKDTIDCYKMIIVWFLKRKLLVQLFAHLYLKPAPTTDSEERRPSRLSVPSLDLTTEGDEEDVAESPTKKSSCYSLTRGISMSEQNRARIYKQYLSPYQTKRLKEVNAGNAMLTNFAKILRHAHDGKTIEEILWKSNLLRQELHDITETFSEFLITIKHPSSI